jgi:tetratricopeptide (TPR) repeat protein
MSLNISDMMADNMGVASITSSSPEAYKYYILGREQFGLDMDKAIEYFGRAIEIDSTFALPYMRIAMAFAFQGRNQEAARYFVEAGEYAHKLPVRERTLLDIYSDIWLRNEFDDAFAKTRSYLTNYPDDKETRGYYALMFNVLKRDPQAALAQLDTIMMIDPNYYPALNWYSEIYIAMEEHDKAVEYAIRAREANPEPPGPMIDLLSIYYRLSRLDEAEQLGNEILERFPDDLSAKTVLVSLHMIRREFDKARRVSELIKEHHSDDNYDMILYYASSSNLKFWEGEFRAGMDFRFDALNVAKMMDDSAQINVRYSSIASYYRRFGELDSALVYTKEAFKWASGFNALMGHSLMLIQLDTANASEARKIMEAGTKDFREKVPAELWHTVDNIERIFEGYCRADTSLVIEALQKFLDESDNKSSGDMLELGTLLVEKGRFLEGKEALEKLLSGEYESPNAFRQLLDAYYLGRACEGLGEIQEAKSYYETVLKYWGNADIQLKEIVDTKRRLRMLTS